MSDYNRVSISDFLDTTLMKFWQLFVAGFVGVGKFSRRVDSTLRHHLMSIKRVPLGRHDAASSFKHWQPCWWWAVLVKGSGNRERMRNLDLKTESHSLTQWSVVTLVCSPNSLLVTSEAFEKLRNRRRIIIIAPDQELLFFQGDFRESQSQIISLGTRNRANSFEEPEYQTTFNHFFRALIWNCRQGEKERSAVKANPQQKISGLYFFVVLVAVAVALLPPVAQLLLLLTWAFVLSLEFVHCDQKLVTTHRLWTVWSSKQTAVANVRGTLVPIFSPFGE